MHPMQMTVKSVMHHATAMVATYCCHMGERHSFGNVSLKSLMVYLRTFFGSVDLPKYLMASVGMAHYFRVLCIMGNRRFVESTLAVDT